MSVNATTYIVYGIKYPYNECPVYDRKDDSSYDKLEPYMPRWNKKATDNKLSVILDGMSGKYIVIGKVIQETKESEGDGLEMMELTVSDSMREAVVKDFKEIFNIDNANPKLYAFTHFS